MDGREEKSAKSVDQTMIYVVDKALLQTGQDCRILPGHTVPFEIARSLEQSTIMAIEGNQPHMIDQPGVSYVRVASALQNDETIMDLEVSTHTPSASGSRLTFPLSQHGVEQEGMENDKLIRHRSQGESSSSANPACRRDILAVGVRLGLQFGNTLAAFSGWLLKSTRRGIHVEDDTINVELEDKFRICESCKTEILTVDNYCHHCGTQYHDVSLRGRKRRSTAHYPSNASLFFLLLLITGAHIMMGIQQPGWVPAGSGPILALAVCILGFWAFLRRRTSISQLISVMFIALNIVLALGFVISGDG